MIEKLCIFWCSFVFSDLYTVYIFLCISVHAFYVKQQVHTFSLGADENALGESVENELSGEKMCSH